MRLLPGEAYIHIHTVDPRYKGVLYNKGFPRYKGVRILIPSDTVGDGQTT